MNVEIPNPELLRYNIIGSDRFSTLLCTKSPKTCK